MNTIYKISDNICTSKIPGKTEIHLISFTEDDVIFKINGAACQIVEFLIENKDKTYEQILENLVQEHGEDNKPEIFEKGEALLAQLLKKNIVVKV